jgi:hypothetical protein
MKPVRVDPEAADELAAAAEWYDAQRAGLGGELLDAIDDAVARLADAAVTCPMVLRRDSSTATPEYTRSR